MKILDKYMPLLAGIGMILFLATSFDAYQQGNKDISWSSKIIISISITLLGLILIIPEFRQPRWRKPQKLIIVDTGLMHDTCKIIEITGEELALYCMSEFQMQYEIDDWPALRDKLESRIQQSNGDPVLLQKWRRQGRICEQAGEKRVATLEYMAHGNHEANIFSEKKMPDSISAAIYVLSANHPNLLIFRSWKETESWLDQLDDDLRNKISISITDFQRKRDHILSQQ